MPVIVAFLHQGKQGWIDIDHFNIEPMLSQHLAYAHKAPCSIMLN